MEVDPFPLRFERKKILLPFHTQTVEDASGLATPNNSHLLTIQSIRILCPFSVYPAQNDDQVQECIIDTGAPFSVFPRKTWGSWPEGTVEWLEPSNEKARLATEVKGITGDIADARLGRVKIILWNLDPERPQSVIETAPFTILAKFMTTDSTSDRAVFGMAGNALERWQKLDIDFHADEAWLVLIAAH